MKEKQQKRKLKRWQKVLLIVVVVILVLLSSFVIRATARGQSVTSLVLEDVFHMIPLADRRDEDNYQKSLAESSKPYVLPDDIRNKYGVSELDSFTDTFMINGENASSDLYIFYLHGGGYWSQPLSMHYSFFNNLAKAVDAQLILPVYPKAPSYHASDVHEMVMDRYLYLVEEMGIDANDIILMGESAGGGLALSFMQVLRNEGLPMPTKAILISPWLDVTNSNPDMKEIQPHDPLLNIESLGFGGIEYAGEIDPKDPLASPIYGSLDGLPPVYVFSGTHDILHADIAKYEEMAEEQKLDATFYVYENMNHCFVGFPIPEGREAIEKIKSIISM